MRQDAGPGHETTPAVEAWAAAQQDVVSAAQAWALGMPRQWPPQLAASGRWQRLVRGTYWTRPFGAPAAVVTLTAARLFAGGGLAPLGTVVGLSALRLRALPCPHGPWRPDIGLPVGITRRQPAGVRYAWPDLRAGEVERVRGMPCTSVARTVADVRTSLSDGHLLAIVDAALRDGQLAATAVTDLVRSVPVLAHADARAESPFESHVRAELLAADLPPATLQHVVRDAGGGFLARLDLAWPAVRLGLEADGAAVHASPAALRDDVRRQNRLVDAGWTLLRFTWADLGAIAAVVRRELWARRLAA